MSYVANEDADDILTAHQVEVDVRDDNPEIHPPKGCLLTAVPAKRRAMLQMSLLTTFSLHIKLKWTCVTTTLKSTHLKAAF